MKPSKVLGLDKMVRVCQISKYLPAVAVLDFLEQEKNLGPLRLKVRETPTGKRIKRQYAVFLVLEEGKDIVGRKSELILMNELMNPQLYVGGKGEIREIHCG
jgi:hypothetical protein